MYNMAIFDNFHFFYNRGLILWGHPFEPQKYNSRMKKRLGTLRFSSTMGQSI